MSNIKLKDHNWATRGVYDTSLQKTQEEINQSNAEAIQDLEDELDEKAKIEIWRIS